MNDIVKLSKLLKILIFCWKELLKQLTMKQKKQKGGFLGMLLGTLGASLLGNMLTGKGVLRASYGNKEGKGVLRADYGNIYIYIFFDSTSSFNKLWNTEVLWDYVYLDSVEFMLDIMPRQIMQIIGKLCLKE